MGQVVVDGVNLTRFLSVPYNARRNPENTSVEAFITNPGPGSNCQLLTLGIVKHAGFDIGVLDYPRIGSKELWEDDNFSEKVLVVDKKCYGPFIDYFIAQRMPLDIFFFWPLGIGEDKSDLKKLHLGVHLGKTGEYIVPILHNPRGECSQIWQIKDFFLRGYEIFGIKRPKKN